MLCYSVKKLPFISSPLLLFYSAQRVTEEGFVVTSTIEDL